MSFRFVNYKYLMSRLNKKTFVLYQSNVKQFSTKILYKPNLNLQMNLNKFSRNFSLSHNLLNSSQNIDSNENLNLNLKEYENSNNLEINSLDQHNSFKSEFDNLEKKETLKIDEFNFLNNNDEKIDTVNILNATDIGLNPYLLPRVFYDLITNLHNMYNMSWISSIAITCICVRVLTFPLYINSKIKSIQFTESMMKMQKSIIDFESINQNNDKILLSKQKDAMNSINSFQKSALGFFISPIASAIIFSSFYFCLRAMSNHPIDSLKTESFLWLPSLCSPDPYCIFPFLTSLTMYLMFRFNMEIDLPSNKFLKVIGIGLPIMIFLVTCQMPACLTFYWFINNNITVLQHSFLKNDKVIEFFKIPKLKYKPIEPQEFMRAQEGFKNKMNSIEMIHKIEEQKELIRKMQEQLKKK